MIFSYHKLFITYLFQINYSNIVLMHLFIYFPDNLFLPRMTEITKIVTHALNYE